MRFIAVLDDCNDSKEAGNDRVQEEGRGREKAKGEWSERGRERGRKRGGKGKDSRKAREGKERKERSEGERALLASVVHVARALYMNVTQDVAVWLSCILCTPTLD